MVPDDATVATPLSSAPPSSAPAPGAPNMGPAQILLDTMHRELESALRAEMRAVQSALDIHTRDLDGQLRAIQSEIDRLNTETRAMQEHPVHALHEAARAKLGILG
jgi:TolA-binding protein